ncbi:uncharacterized protein LOC129792859 [Lutzomyia longipalpis]|uniref:uncharacterized protein LOC129792859 n=1 Tax=Lutzomyia longipalpis TaxID=7200 RepID=UPI0024842A5F|nr:uncharacterized protein LOC129792859 [Lutzomyia longipalpis]
MHKILGITIDNRLKFMIHRKTVRENLLQYLNLLKYFGNKKTGIHPDIMLTVYKAMIKSRLLYGAPAMYQTKMSTSNLHPLQAIKNEALRIIMGYTRSTTITTIMAETTEMPIKFDSERSTCRFLINNKMATSDKIDYINDNTNYKELLKKHENIVQTAKLQKQEEIIPSNLKILENIPGLENSTKNQISTQKLRMCTLQKIEEYKDHFKIFTDGSIKDEKRGFGIFFEQTKETISRKIKEEIPIYTVEMIAILYAIIMAIRMKKKKIVILTDSKSAILSLKNLKSEKYYENIIHQIAKKNPKIDITLQWIPSHIGIVGNDSADKAAKEGGKSNEIYQVEIPKKRKLQN